MPRQDDPGVWAEVAALEPETRSARRRLLGRRSVRSARRLPLELPSELRVRGLAPALCRSHRGWVLTVGRQRALTPAASVPLAQDLPGLPRAPGSNRARRARRMQGQVAEPRKNTLCPWRTNRTILHGEPVSEAPRWPTTHALLGAPDDGPFSSRFGSTWARAASRVPRARARLRLWVVRLCALGTGAGRRRGDDARPGWGPLRDNGWDFDYWRHAHLRRSAVHGRRAHIGRSTLAELHANERGLQWS